MLTIASIASTASSAERPRSGAAAAWAAMPWKRNLADTMARLVDGLGSFDCPGCHGDRRVHVVEQAGAHHVALGAAAFLGGGPVEADRARAPAGREPVLHRDGRRHRAGAEQVVAAAVAGRPFRDRLPLRHRGLRQPRQGVELADERDDRLAAPIAGHERGRDVGHPRLDGEAGRRQFLLEQGAAPGLEIAELGEIPNLHRHVGVLGAPRVEALQHPRPRLASLGGRSRARARRHEEDQDETQDFRHVPHVTPRRLDPAA